MLQRYDISMGGKANNLTIKEFARETMFPRRSNYIDTSGEKYLLLHQMTYDSDTINAAIRDGREALISELRCDQFYPIRSCVEILADKVIELSKDKSGSFSEVFFDDKTLLPPVEA